ncbi:hypothetical protein TCAL_12031 [Tigriopus californicus]|uniref:Uncharacterized protein n=1 Tax=Tigriopus californicus TaxID=6832 RepID=A0A553PH14_TIGCA|nr:hypothetical protein TCAL_12031 [Tigriopus californicus]|eukprot:TCALIF_12031-PA protein Name:"Protein of unknown function" AED:0.02 eAED:0.02 QI:254/0.8/0.83/1/1/1/6/277/469
MGCCSKTCLTQTEMVMGIVFGLWNNVTTVMNAKNLFEKGHPVLGGLIVFFLMFPGLVTSIGFLILHFLGHRKIGKMPPGSVLLSVGLLFFLYPVVPIALCGYTLVTGRKRHLAALAKLFEGFLDDGPQFVIKLIVVVFYRIGIGKDKEDIIFTLSMITSFLALSLFGLAFNELNTNKVVKIWLCMPMLAAFAGARAFTMAVFLKETFANTTEWVGGMFVLALFCVINIGSFKYCGQDLIRSIVFGLCSLLIPAGYNNIAYFYQCPDQALIVYSINPNEVQVEQRIVDRFGDGPNRDADDVFGTEAEPDFALRPSAPPLSEGNEMGVVENRGGREDHSQRLGSVVVDDDLSQMRSGLFLLFYTISNAFIISGCALYLMASRDLDANSDDALVFPLFLGVVPGTFFALARAIILPDLKPEKAPLKLWKVIKVTLCLIFSIIAFCSLGPAIFWSALYKALRTVHDVLDSEET